MVIIISIVGDPIVIITNSFIVSNNNTRRLGK